MKYTIRIITSAKNQSDDNEIGDIVDALVTYYGVSHDADYQNNVVWLHEVDSEEKLYKILSYLREHRLIQHVDYHETEDEISLAAPSHELVSDSSEWVSKLELLSGVVERINNDRN